MREKFEKLGLTSEQAEYMELSQFLHARRANDMPCGLTDRWVAALESGVDDLGLEWGFSLLPEVMQKLKRFLELRRKLFPDEVRKEKQRDKAWSYQNSLQRMPYEEYLKTEHWQKKRAEALGWAKNRCQICNSPKALEVHHRTYASKGREDLSDLITLCSVCHEVFHLRLGLYQG